MPDLITAIESAALVRFAGAGLDHLGKLAWERIQQVADKATALLSAVGREPQPVKSKLLIPLVQAASLESDSILIECWAALLANAADPARRVEVPAFYAGILRELKPQDALVLRALYFQTGYPSDAPRNGSAMVKQLQALANLSYKQAHFSVDNLLRLRLLTGQTVTKPDLMAQYFNAPGTVVSTELGLGFMLACAPPVH